MSLSYGNINLGRANVTSTPSLNGIRVTPKSTPSLTGMSDEPTITNQNPITHQKLCFPTGNNNFNDFFMGVLCFIKKNPIFINGKMVYEFATVHHVQQIFKNKFFEQEAKKIRGEPCLLDELEKTPEIAYNIKEDEAEGDRYWEKGFHGLTAQNFFKHWAVAGFITAIGLSDYYRAVSFALQADVTFAKSLWSNLKEVSKCGFIVKRFWDKSLKKHTHLALYPWCGATQFSVPPSRALEYQFYDGSTSMGTYLEIGIVRKISNNINFNDYYDGAQFDAYLRNQIAVGLLDTVKEEEATLIRKNLVTVNLFIVPQLLF